MKRRFIHIKQSLRNSLWEGALSAPFNTISTGVLLTGFALYLGASPLEISIIISLPFLTQIVQFFAPWFIDKVGSRRKLTSYGTLYSRLVWMLVAALPALLLFDFDPVPLFIVLSVVSLLFFNLGLNSWLSWMSDLVPTRFRGRFFGMRNMYVGLLSMGMLVLTGLALDFFRTIRMEGFGYSLIILFGIALAYFSFRFTLLIDDVPQTVSERISPSLIWRQIRENRKFRSILSFLAIWTIVTGVAAPFYYVHLYENLHWNYSQATLYAAITAGLPFLLQPIWGKLLDRVGHKPLLQICLSGVSVIPLIWLLMAPEWSWILWIEAFISGTFWAGLNITLFNIVLYGLPGEKKASALAVVSGITGLLNFCAMLLGGFIVTWFAFIEFHIGAWVFSPFHITFLLSFLGRLPMSRFARTIDEPEAKDIGVVVQLIQTGMAKRVGLGRQFWIFRGSRDTEA
ncbi:MAG: MFS transporter [Candidatus Marinimicrobia bacterium]|nr:MFS transporter [Candidatus Neomarinimicrobiota bacterium]MCF7827851.1 MFS transporter [Candidatus Neomarinimicrobiota bacterium]MCF7879394.1 MFS transporter [Candidatus Neomarinimicrobiota bacterium]